MCALKPASTSQHHIQAKRYISSLLFYMCRTECHIYTCKEHRIARFILVPCAVASRVAPGCYLFHTASAFYTNMIFRTTWRRRHSGIKSLNITNCFFSYSEWMLYFFYSCQLERWYYAYSIWWKQYEHFFFLLILC